jgi:ligand-binding sensor domain-containing protein
VKFTGSTWTRFNRGNTPEMPHDGITYLKVDAKGALWVGTQAGLARRERNGKWTSFRADSRLGELAGEVVYSLSTGPSGEIWACIKGGAARHSDGKWSVFTKNEYSGLLTRYVYFALPGPEGEVWFATGKGAVAMFPPPAEED